MPYDALVITAYPDDAEVQMGGTIVKLTDYHLKWRFLCLAQPSDCKLS
jgi:LmbE family N-acetylglucosaminyl deacetylase